MLFRNENTQNQMLEFLLNFLFVSFLIILEILGTVTMSSNS